MIENDLADSRVIERLNIWVEAGQSNGNVEAHVVSEAVVISQLSMYGRLQQLLVIFKEQDFDLLTGIGD